MPPVSSPGSHGQPTEHTTDPSDRSRRTPDRAAKVRFRRAVTLMVMTLFLPGSAQLVAGTPRGRPDRDARLAGAAGAASSRCRSLSASSGTASLFWVASNTMLLGLLRLVLMLLAIGWALLFIDAWRLGQPLTLVKNQRLAVVGINGVLCFARRRQRCSSAPTWSASSATSSSRCSATARSPTPSHGRYNVLLLGGDSGAGRWGLRPDSMTVASIDEDTGQTVLVGLPRNMTNFTFAEGSVMDEQFPDGFDCEDCYLNGVATWAGDNKELFPGSEQPGRRRDHPGDRGHHRPEDQLLGDGQPRRASRTSSTRSAGSPSTCATGSRSAGLGSDVHRLHRAGPQEAQRPRHPLVRPRPRGLRRLLADGPAEVRDERDAHPDQPADGAAQLRARSRKASQAACSQTNLPRQRARHRSSTWRSRRKSQKIATVSLVPPVINTGRPRPSRRSGRWSQQRDRQGRGQGRQAGQGQEEGRRRPDRWLARAPGTAATPPTSPTTSPRPADGVGIGL